VPRAIASFVTEVKGEEHFVHAGEVLPPSHPVVKARPELFEPEVPAPKPTRPVGEVGRSARATPRSRTVDSDGSRVTGTRASESTIRLEPGSRI